MCNAWRRLAAATLVALVGVAASTAQSPADQFHGWLRSGNVTALAAAIDKTPDLATRADAEGIQPLAWAAFYGQKGVFDLLLARGADPKATNPAIGTVLHAAVLGGQAEIIRTLAARGVDLNAGGEARLPPLVFAVRRGLAPSTNALLDAGAAVNARDAAGNTALLLAASDGHVAMVQALLARKADIGSANDLGITPMEAALREGHTAVVELLRAAGAAAPAAMPVLTGAYLGQPTPDETRRVFAPRVISTERRELNAAFTPDGRTLFFCRTLVGSTTRILVTTLADGAWRAPRPAPFGRADASDVDMFVTADGAEIYFSSERPAPNQAPPAPAKQAAEEPDSDTWVARRQGASWGPATWLGPEVNARGASDYYPTLTRSGTLYFSSNRPGGLGENDIYRVRRVNGRWRRPENLGAPVNTPGPEFDPFIAPDESYLVFASERPGGLGASDLYVSVHTQDGSWAPPVNLGPRVNSTFSDYTPMVSPDGRYLFFTSGAPGSDDLYWIAASVIRKAIEARRQCSADGRRLFFNGSAALLAQSHETLAQTSADSGLAVIFYSGRAGNNDIFILQPEQREPVNLTRHKANDMCPAASPDGRRIAFLSDRGGNVDIYSMAIDGSDVRQLTSSGDTEEHPEYSPDGRRIVFVKDFGQRAEIWIMNADGTDQKQLTSGSWRDERPFVSPDSSKILFMSNRDGNYEIYTMAIDGSRQTRITRTAQHEVFPAWSPDGTKIVYSQKYKVGESMQGMIRVMNADGSDDHAVTGVDTRDENGLWSPDGRFIIFQSVRDGNFEVYQVNADGGNPVRLTDHPAWDGWASYVPSPKGKS